MIEKTPLSKLQCAGCGLVHRHSPYAVDEIYSEQYGFYTNRPGAEVFGQGRHPEVADLIAEAISPLRPRRILEVGCGNGSLLSAFRELWPDVETAGIEPSEFAADRAREAGHEIFRCMLSLPALEQISGPYDLVYSVHVIEHSPDPLEFLTAKASLVSSTGAVVVVCPDASTPHAEIVHSDHLYSFLPRHLETMARQVGLAPSSHQQFLLEKCREYNQLMVAKPESAAAPADTTASSTANDEGSEELWLHRREYLERWSGFDEHLNAQVGEAERVFCFGTGGWAANLAGYAPRTWSRIGMCVVDSASEKTFLEKEIIDYSALHQYRPEVVIAGVNPATQPAIEDKLKRDGFRTVRWDGYMDH